jgi:hypothetical protein
LFVERMGASFLGASPVVLNGVTDSETLEVIACREGLAVAADLLLQHLGIASDCINAVRSISGPGKCAYGHIRKYTIGFCKIVDMEWTGI